jgi:hypothetical protein
VEPGQAAERYGPDVPWGSVLSTALDAGRIIGSSERDEIHFEVEAHQALGRAVARIVQEQLGA